MLKGSALILTGTVGAQVIALACLPVVSRLYSPESFGVFQTYSSVLLVLLPLASFRYEYAILRVKSDASLDHILLLSFGLNLILMMIVFIAWIVYRSIWPEHFLSDPWMGVAMALAILAAGMLQTASYLPVRNKRFRTIALNRLLQTSVFQFSAIALGFVFARPAGIALILVDLVSRVIATVFLIGDHFTRRRKRPPQLRPGQVRRVAHAYRRYPTFSMPSSLVSAISNALPIFAFAALFSIGTSGQFAMAWRVVFMPVGMIAFAVAQALNAELSASLRGSERTERFHLRKTLRTMVVLAIVPAVVFPFLGKPILVFILGPTWTEAADIAVSMSALIFFGLVHGPINTSLIVMGFAHIQFAWEAFRLLILLGFWAVVRSMQTISVADAAFLYSLVIAGCATAYISLALHFSRERSAFGQQINGATG